MSLSRTVIGAFSAFIATLIGVGIVVPSKTAVETKPIVSVSYAPSIVPIPASSNVIVLAPQTPIDPGDPVPTPRPTRTPTPTPVAEPFTIGCQFPPIYDKWWLHSTDQAAYIAGMVENTEYRTNVMFNWEGQFKHEMQAVASTGMVLGSLSFDTYLLESCTPDNVTYKDGTCSGMFQINNFIKQIDASYTGVYTINIKPLGGTGRIFFYATMIDNRSSDCTTFTQFRKTKNNNMWSESGLYYQGSFDAETEVP